MKQFLSKHFDLKGSSYRLLLELIKKIGSEHLEVRECQASQLVSLFEKKCKEMQEQKSNVKGWAKDNFVQRFSSGMSTLAAAQTLATDILRVLTTLKAVRLLEVRQMSGERRKGALLVRRIAKPLITQQFWKAATTYFGTMVMGLGMEGEKVLPQSNLLKSETMQGLANGPAYSMPQLWKAGEASAVGTLFFRIIEQVAAKLGGIPKRMTDAMEEDGSYYTMIARLPLSSEIVTDELLPKTFFSEKPEGMTTWNTPCLFGAKRWGWRFGATAWPSPGCGGYLNSVAGSAEIFLLPMHCVDEAGGSIENLSDFLNSMSPGDCQAFLSKRSVYFQLEEGDGAWIPWGWYATSVATSELSLILWQPWMHQLLVKAMSSEKVQAAVVKWNIALCQSLSSENAAFLKGLCWWRELAEGGSSSASAHSAGSSQA